MHAAAAEAGVEVDAEVLDVTDDGATAALVDRIEPWAVVASAGFMNPGLIEDVPIDDARHQLEVMLLAPARLVQLALPGMRRRGGGRIVVVSSPLGEASLPLQGWYSATKRALERAVRRAPRRGRRRCRRRRAGRAPGGRHPAVGRGPRGAWPSGGRGRRALRCTTGASPCRTACSGRAADPTEVAEVVGRALRAAHPRFRYRTPAAAVPFAVAARVVPTSVRDRVVRALGAI